MDQNASHYIASMSPQQAARFSAEYESVRKDEIMGALLAFFLGTFGAHHFYLGRNQLGILYALFFWTGIPAVCGFVECFLMPGRVRAFNFAQANTIDARIKGIPGVGSPAAPVAANALSCQACGQPLNGSALFCTHCGGPVGSIVQTIPA